MAKSNLNQLSTEDLQTEIRRRERKINTLVRKRDRLAGQLAELDSEIASLGGAVSGAAGAGRKRPRNESNLADALVALLTGAELTVTEAAQQVQEQGYATSSPNFRTIVNQTLLKDSRFKRVGRGVYTAGKAGSSKKKKTTKRK